MQIKLGNIHVGLANKTLIKLAIITIRVTNKLIFHYIQLIKQAAFRTWHFIFTSVNQGTFKSGFPRINKRIMEKHTDSI